MRAKVHTLINKCLTIVNNNRRKWNMPSRFPRRNITQKKTKQGQCAYFLREQFTERQFVVLH